MFFVRDRESHTLIDRAGGCGVVLRPVAMISASGSCSWQEAVDRALGRRNHTPVGSDHANDGRLGPVLSAAPVERTVVQNSGRTATVLAMDPAVWSNLPFHILESVLACLPISSLLKLRCVCKRFNNILYSPSLREASRRRHVRAWHLFRGESRECVSFNPETDSWCMVPLEFLPSSKGGVVATAGGLLCVRHGNNMIVCNPLSKAWLQLPPMKTSSKFPIIGMVMDREAQVYKVVVAGRSSTCGKNLITEVYNSQTKTWKDVNQHPVQHHYQTSAIHCEGFLYSAGFDGILAYDLKQEQWKDMKGPAMQDTQLMLPQICECNGHLLMVEVVSEQFQMTHVTIWAMRQDDKEWFKLNSMPQMILKDVIDISGTRLFTYFGHGDLICFMIARRRVLVYSIRRRMWRWWPRCPFINGFARRCTTLAYEPRVEALV